MNSSLKTNEAINLGRTGQAVIPPSKPADAKRKPAPSRFTLDGRKMSVVVLIEPAALEAYLPELEDLAANAIEPNIFYEPWILWPSLKAFGHDRQFFFALVFAPTLDHPHAPQTLCGFFPLVRERRYKGLPVSVLRLWKHRYCLLCTPLIRTEHASECLKAFFKWLADPDHLNAANCAIVELREITGDGPFHTLLADYLYNSTRLSYMEDIHVRAFFRPAENAEVYLSRALSGRRRKDMRQQAKQLAGVGRIEYKELTEQDDVDQWMSDFLSLEASGWKGRNGSAIASLEKDREFFLEIAREGFRRGRLRMRSLNLNGQPIAQKLDLVAGRAGFAFKIAYDESYSRFSPGVLLELENLRRLHEEGQFDWVDSCAVPDHFMINRLYTSRRVIQTVVIAAGRNPGGLIVSILPLLRWLNRLLRRRKSGAPQHER
jgi:GNAT acetyltransferase-like protein